MAAKKPNNEHGRALSAFQMKLITRDEYKRCWMGELWVQGRALYLRSNWINKPCKIRDRKHRTISKKPTPTEKNTMTLSSLAARIKSATGIDGDKVFHFASGMATAFIATLFFQSTLAGVIAAISVGIGKEIIDKYDYGKFDVADAVVTIIGGAIGAVVTSAIVTA